MSEKDEFEGWSPENLREFVLTGKHPDFSRPRSAVRSPEKPQEVSAEDIEPSAMKRGLAGLGGALQEPVLGAVEKVQLAFPGEGEAGKRRIAEIAGERAQRRAYRRQLEETPAGQAGAFAGQVLPQFAAPATAGGQALMSGALGFLGGGPDRPKGIGSELGSSAVHGALDTATTFGAMKGLEVLGTSINAARGRYTPEGQRAMDLNAAAGRMGVDDVSVGQLFPTSWEGKIAQHLPSYPDDVMLQAAKLKQALEKTRQVPTPTGVGTETQVLPGGKLADELAGAVNVRLQQGRAKYGAVDDFVTQNNLGAISPIYSLPQLTAMQKRAIKGDEAPLLAVNLMANSNPTSLSWLGDALAKGMKAADIKKAGMPFGTYHDMRVAAGKALSNLDRVNPANKTATQWEAQKLLRDLRDGLDNEVEAWAKKHADNADAMGLYKNAKDFFRDVVAPTVIENPVARKATSRSRGWNDLNPTPMYSAVTNPQNAGLVEALRPTMGQTGRDALDTLAIPEIGRSIVSGRAPAFSAEGLGPLARLEKTALSPLLRSWYKTPVKKGLMAAENPLQSPLTGKALLPLGQYGQSEAEDWAQSLLRSR